MRENRLFLLIFFLLFSLPSSLLLPLFSPPSPLLSSLPSSLLSPLTGGTIDVVRPETAVEQVKEALKAEPIATHVSISLLSHRLFHFKEEGKGEGEEGKGKGEEREGGNVLSKDVGVVSKLSEIPFEFEGGREEGKGEGLPSALPFQVNFYIVILFVLLVFFVFYFSPKNCYSKLLITTNRSKSVTRKWTEPRLFE